MIKFGRDYKLVMQGNQTGGGQELTFRYPLTCKFDVDRKTFAMANTGNFTIYGLSNSNIKSAFYDLYELGKSPVPIKFFAGYNTQPPLPMIFFGNIVDAYTTREGPELVTHIQALDGQFGIDNSVVSADSGTGEKWQFSPTMEKLMKNISGVEFGGIFLDAEPPPGARAFAPNGFVWQVLQENLPEGAELFIDNGKVYILSETEIIPSEGTDEISNATGLLNIPVRHGGETDCQMLFTPDLILGQPVVLRSELATWVNGVYKIIGLHHSGTISGTESGDARTDVALLNLDIPL